ncbi:MAG: hypothetical protein PHP97_03135 [Candidatus Shapirobacteria bacterium]|nr:hypothetical protein [Candidatus Shapirobacteria bacterium]MDD3002809.1 hypothetical protein [Candidatus Shapirobacteria bacterium]MDD4383457.1 hypothetical protein [Candidatus Shapirobacteria bacterium]
MICDIKKQIDYLIKLTDKVGIIEHSIFNKPNYLDGYCVDDNARALQVCLRFKEKYPILEKFIPIYFNFLKSAVKEDRLYADMNSDGSWQEKFEINGEHYGRTLAAFGEINATQLFDQIYLLLTKEPPRHIRVSSQVILGLKYHQPEKVRFWADLIVEQYLKEKNDSWKWFESTLSYDLGRIPLALLTAYQITNDLKYFDVAFESLDFLIKMTFDEKNNYFVFPGNKGWFTKSGLRIIFDQQPIEAGSATEVYSLAFQISKNKKYRDLALKAFAWYSGNNIIKANMIDPQTGGVYDGFGEKEVNKNQGAESVLSYLLAYNSLNLI